MGDVKRLAVCVLAAASGLAEQPELAKKPACTAANHGRFWPEAANSDTKAARRYSQCGTLEICALGAWKYKWKPLSVNVRQLGKTQKEPSPECVVTPVPENSEVSTSK